MTKNLIITLVVIVGSLVPGFVRAAYLEDGYFLSSFSSTAGMGANIAIVNFGGTVYPTNPGDNPATASLHYVSQRLSGGNFPEVPHPNFNSNAQGVFSTALLGLECGQEYSFKLYQGTSDLIQVDPVGNNGPLANAFSMTLACAQGPGQNEDTQYAPNSAGATTLAGVNWGNNIVVTDNSITINNAQAIPLPPNGPKTFKVEYGTGTEGPNGQPVGGQALGFSQEITRISPYFFSVQIPNLAPDTAYYFTLHEVVGNVSTNLLVYEYVQTNELIGNQTLSVQLLSDESARMYGNMVNSNGVPLAGVTATIEIHSEDDPGSSIVQQANVTIGAGNLVNGPGFYEHTFNGLTPDTQYYVLVRNASTQAILVGTIPFTMPSPYDPGQQTFVAAEPSYTGLVTCDGPNCDFNSLIDTINRVINFIIFYIGFPMVAIVAAWAGIKLIMSGGDPGAKKDAKAMLTKVVLGLIVALLCWTLVKFLLILLGYVPSGALWGVLGTAP